MWNTLVRLEFWLSFPFQRALQKTACRLLKIMGIRNGGLLSFTSDRGRPTTIRYSSNEEATIPTSGGAGPKYSLATKATSEADLTKLEAKITKLRRATYFKSVANKSPMAAVPPRSTVKKSDHDLILKLITKKLRSNSKQAVECALNEIGSLLFTANAELKMARRDAVFRSGGHVAIVEAMTKFPRTIGVQTQGCRALANATSEMGELMCSLSAVGGVKAVLAAMTAFPGDEVLQICGSCALRNFTALPTTAKLVLREEGFSVTVKAMENFPMNANIQVCGCWIIAHVCLDKGNKVYLQGARCFGLIGDAADNHPKQQHVQKAARQAAERVWELRQS
jgi:hypothetical protein